MEVRRSPQTSGLAYKEYGQHGEIDKYSNREITEMLYGIYKESKTLVVDGDYFVDLKEVNEIICVLEKVTYVKKPTAEDLKTNHHNKIKNIRTYYVSDYFLTTEKEIAGMTRHKITNYLSKIGAIRSGRRRFRGLFSISNYYQSLEEFKVGLYPKDLYHPIKRYINGLFFNDDYRINKFKVESNFKVE